MCMFPQWITKKTIAWALYDFADTAFSALFITFFFPILIKVHLGGNELQIGLAMGLSVAVAAFLVPLIGAVSDISGKRMPILIGATIVTAITVITVGYVGLGLALFLGFLARISNLISKDIYDATMIGLVPRSLYGSLSGFGIGIGYVGTIVSLATGYILLSYFGWDTILGIQTIFWEAGIFYAIFSLPLFLLVKDVRKIVTKTIPEILAQGLRTIIHTIKTLPDSPILGRFLLASFFYNNGMSTVIIFLALYGLEIINMSVQQFFPIFAIMAVGALLGAIFSGHLSDKWGPIVLIKCMLVVWIIIVTTLIIIPSYTTFLIVGSIGGAALGAIWTLNRHVIASISPKEKIAELFGLEGLTEKFSGLLGPIVFGLLVTTVNYTAALLSIIVFFVIGLFFVYKIKI